MHSRTHKSTILQPDFRLIKGASSRPESVPVSLIIKHIPDWILESQFQRHSQNTIDAKNLSLGKFVWWLNYTERQDVSKHDIKAFVGYMINSHLQPEGRWGKGHFKPLSERGVQFHFINIRAYLRWMYHENLIDYNPAEEISIAQPPKADVQPFSNDHVAMLLAAAGRTEFALRNIAIVSFLIDTGLRATELVELRLNHLNMLINGGTASVVGKGAKPRTAPYSRTASRALRRYLQETPRLPNDLIFVSGGGHGHERGAALSRTALRLMFLQLQRISGITGIRVSPHTCRHTFAVNFLRSGGSMVALQLMLGHENMEMTRIYSKLATADVMEQHRLHSPLDAIVSGK